MASTPIRVLLADDYAIVRNGVARILNEQPDIRVAEAEDGESAIVLYGQERPAAFSDRADNPAEVVGVSVAVMVVRDAGAPPLAKRLPHQAGRAG